MWQLLNREMNYAWGSPTSIPDFVGTQPTGEPVAELWMGAHPLAPSSIVDGDSTVLLPDLIASDSERILGPDVLSWTSELPFLVKLLAAATPLSLQVHPTAVQAEAGFAAEEKKGIGLTDPMRVFKDRNAKPEIMIALGPTRTLVGFRPVTDILVDLERIEGLWASKLRWALTESLQPLHDGLSHITDRGVWEEHRNNVLPQVAALARSYGVFSLITELTDTFPTDPGVMAPLLMNCASYGHGSVLYTEPETLHAHVNGFGVEVMATSDNVIRAGLTPKHLDREALLASLNGSSTEPHFITSTPEETTFVPPVNEFAVTIFEAGNECTRPGPRIALVIDGEAELVAGGTTLRLPRGHSAFIAHSDGPLTTRGKGTILLTYVPTRK